ncbi:MAG: ester cyclase [Vicinamibacterales bacterium]
MTREAIEAFFDERSRLWAARDMDGLADGHAEDGTVDSPMFGHRRGRAAIRDAYRALLATFPDWALTSQDLLIDGDRVAQVFQATATHVGDFLGLQGTNRRFVIQGVRLFTMRDGLVAHERRLYDFTGLLIQVGILRGKPAKD